ncbi:hypothetical protein [Streptomyces sp. NPDC002666]
MNPRSTPVFSYSLSHCSVTGQGRPRRFYMNGTELAEQGWRYLARIFGVAVPR